MFTLTSRTRRNYLNALMRQPRAWVESSMRNPSPDMLRKPSLIALHAIALRRAA